MPTQSAISLFRIRGTIQYLDDVLPDNRGDGSRPTDKFIGVPSLTNLLGTGTDVPALWYIHNFFHLLVISNPFFFIIYIHMACRVNKFNLLANLAVRNCIRMFVFVDLDISVFHNSYFFKYPDLITLFSQWHRKELSFPVVQKARFGFRYVVESFAGCG